jgi:serine protease Do
MDENRGTKQEELNMRNIKIRTALMAAALVAVGLVAGFLVTQAFTAGEKLTDQQMLVAAEMAALDKRLAELPPMQQSFVLVAKRVTPAVVTIHSEQVLRNSDLRMQIPEEFREFFNDDFFFNAPRGEQRVQGLGSGVVVDSDGIVLTNNHVVARADKIKVTLNDNRTLDAEVVGTDPESDIAVLRIDATGLATINFGDSDAVDVGEWVLAVGNPFSEALRHTVTAGIISAKGRGLGLAVFEDFIQTDAAINPGNSGGALVNLQGELIGINTAISSETGRNDGVGFAIPSNMAKRVMESILEHGKVLRGYLGLYPQDIDEATAKAFGLEKSAGALVGQVDKGTAAEKAGLKRGDIILEINGRKVSGRQDVFNIIGALAPGTEVNLKILRDNKEMEIPVTLAERPSTQTGQEQGGSGESSGEVLEKLGLQVTPLTDSLAERLGYQNEEGVLIARVYPGTIAQRSGLQQGDLIKEVNRKPVAGISDLNAALSGLKSGDTLLFWIKRGTGAGYFAFQVP